VRAPPRCSASTSEAHSLPRLPARRPTPAPDIYAPQHQGTLRQQTRRIGWRHRPRAGLLLRRQNLGDPLPRREHGVMADGTAGAGLPSRLRGMGPAGKNPAGEAEQKADRKQSFDRIAPTGFPPIRGGILQVLRLAGLLERPSRRPRIKGARSASTTIGRRNICAAHTRSPAIRSRRPRVRSAP